MASDPASPADLALAGLLHDLNNVFETISEAAELVSSDPQWASVMAAVLRSVERGQRLVGVYADQSRSGPELEVVLDRAATFLSDFLARVPGVKVKLHRRLPAGVRLPGDPGAWERVFMNLLLNAAQAMREAGGGEIHVEGRLDDGELELKIHDSGPGIPEAILPKIFRPRFSTRGKHAGLGLHIVHSLLEQCGGTVKAENHTEGPGAVFTITAPVRPAEA